jgi:hypothetical protein
MIDLITATFAALQFDADKWGIPKIGATDSTFQAIITMIYTLIGALSLFYIVRAALLFITSNGDANEVKQARTTILIAVAALVLSTLVFGIVNFFITKVGGK